MTARARRLLEALADGPLTRSRIFERTGYMMSNNGAAELRAAGYTVVCSRAGREYVYELISDGVLSEPPIRAASKPHVDHPQAAANTVGGSLNPSAEEPDGQMAFEVAA